MPDAIDRWVKANKTRFVDELIEFLRIPSISTLSAHRADMTRAAKHLAGRLREAGLSRVKLVKRAGHPPLVYGECPGEKGAPTVLSYGHYDVQPVDPASEWKTPPFEPTIRSGKLLARGASDDKGQLYTHVKAVEGLLAAGEKLPCTVKMLFEGEEESGSEFISEFVPENRDLLKSDCVLVSDTAMFARGVPTMDIGLRGILYTEVLVRGGRSDLHSGNHGGPAPNPLQAVAEIITRCKAPSGKVLIPGFHDDVQRVPARESRGWKRLPFSDEAYRKGLGAAGLMGEKRHSALARMWARPTFEVHGIAGGFVGEGAKTVIPAQASFKLSMRLVPDQDPAKIMRALEKHVRRVAPPWVRVEVKRAHGAKATLVDAGTPCMRAALGAMRDSFGSEPILTRSGGSIPLVSLFQKSLGVPVALMGFGLPDDNLHAPNEKIDVSQFLGGIGCVMRFFKRLAAEAS